MRALCEARHVPFADDPSNDDSRFDRVKLRKTLAGDALFDSVGLARSLEALADAAVALDWTAERLEAEMVAHDGDALVLAETGLPAELLRRLLLRMIARINPQADAPRGPSLDQAIVQLFHGKTVTLADCIVTSGAQWIVRRAPARKRDVMICSEHCVPGRIPYLGTRK